MKKNQLPLCIIISLILFPAAVSGDSFLSDPGIPHGEQCFYTIYQDEVRGRMTSRTEVLEENGRKIYNIFTQSREEKTESKILASYMLPVYKHSFTENERFTEESTLKLDPGRQGRSSGILVLNYSTLDHILRGFPFDDPDTMPVKSLMSSDNDDTESFEISIKYSGRETVSIERKNYECHKLTMDISAKGVMGMMSKLFPKTSFWYSTSPSHYMVRYEGNNGPPGSPKTIIEIEGPPVFN
jgi:hypothetical protein